MNPIFWILIIPILLCGCAISELLFIGLIIWLVLMALGMVAQAPGGTVILAVVVILLLKNNNRRRW